MDCNTDHPSVASKPKRRVNSCLPEFYMAIEDRSILRAHLISRNTDSNGNDVTTHFIAVPLDELPKYEADDNCAENSYIWEISSLTMDQLRKLLTKLKYSCSNKNRAALLEMISLIGTEAALPAALEGLKQNSQKRIINRSKVVFRLITTIFHDNFRDKLGNLNDNKKRVDFETNNMFKSFFEQVSKVIGDNSAMEHQNLLWCAESRYDDEYYSHLDQRTIGDEHPSGVLSEKQLELTIPAKCQQMYRDLVSLYMKIDNMMTVSGTHDDDVFSFTAAALKQRGLSSSYTEKAVYYFVKQCQFYPTISRCIATSLPSNVSCSNDIININDDEEGIVTVPSMASYSAKSKRKGVDDDPYMNTICTNLGTMTKEYCSQNRRKEKESAMKEIRIERESEKNEIRLQRAAVMNEINITRNMISTNYIMYKVC
jgi:hypothetical protein